MAHKLRGIHRRGTNFIGAQKIRAAARLARLHLDLEVHPHAYIAPGVLPNFWGTPGTSISLRLGAGSRIEDGVTLRLKGGASVEMGDNVVLRTGAVLNVSGRLVFEGGNLVSWNSVIHSAQQVTIGAGSGMSEGVTIVDSTHYRNGPGDNGYMNAIANPISIGSGVWLATKSVVLAGVRIGDEVTLAALSMATRSLPSGCLAAGSPARVIRERYDGPSPEERAGFVAVDSDV